MLDIPSYLFIKKYIDDVVGEGGGTTNYNALSNKPLINGVVLLGDKTSDDLHIEGGGGGGGHSEVENENLILPN